jgi:hypothetical protein
LSRSRKVCLRAWFKGETDDGQGEDNCCTCFICGGLYEELFIFKDMMGTAEEQVIKPLSRDLSAADLVAGQRRSWMLKKAGLNAMLSPWQ